LGRKIAQPRGHSEASARAVDRAVRTLLQEAQTRAEGTIEEHRSALEKLVAALEAHETLYRDDIAECLGPIPRRIKKQFSAVRSP
jgi:cell division protease FtsH